MTKRIGLIQTHGIGDIIIALPIADHYRDEGFEVLWPIDERFVSMFQRIKPEIRFFPVAAGPDYFFDEPSRILRENDAQRTLILYSYLSSLNICDSRLAAALKFDEYKYAISRVPFAKKWSLNYQRDLRREQELFDGLGITGKYVCIHTQGSNMQASIEVPAHMTSGYQVIEVKPLTDSVFDWLLTLERAEKLILLDSGIANLVEQLNLANEKSLIVRSSIAHTPVYKNGWRFIFPGSFAPE